MSDTDSRWVRFDDLSPIARGAIEKWDDDCTAEELAEAARAFEWQEVVLPTQSLIERIMTDKDTADYFKTWEAYHQWYLADDFVPDHGTSRWPVIEGLGGAAATGGGTLDDGWHRFHSYVRAGDTTVPVLRRRLRG